MCLDIKEAAEILADDLGQGLGPVFARKNLVSHEPAKLTRTRGAASLEEICRGRLLGADL